MTTIQGTDPVDQHAEPESTAGGREARRSAIARLLHRDPAVLPDGALLTRDLGLDSLDMMTLLTWLEEHGVHIEPGHDRPASIGQILSLLDQAAAPGVSIRVHNRPGEARGPSDAAASWQPPADPLVPVLGDATFRLTPVRPDDAGYLYGLAVRPETCFRWRYRGAPPPFNRFADDLWNQILVQYVTRRADDDQPVGHVLAYGADPSMRYAYLGAVFEPAYIGTGLAARVVAIFVRHLFHTFPLHKLYLEVPGFNWAQMQSGEGRLFRVEGVLADHDYYAGRYWDQYVCAVYRDKPVEEAVIASRPPRHTGSFIEAGERRSEP